MASDDERLVFQLEARIKDFERNFQRAGATGTRTYNQLTAGSSRATRQMEQDFQRSTSRINQMLASTSTHIGSFGKGLAGGIVGGLSVAGITGLVKGLGDVAHGIAEIGDQAKKAGLSAKAFQELKFVAEQNRIGVDSLTDGIKELNLRADEFISTGGGSAAESFKRLGYDAGTLATKLKDPSALFTEIIGKLGKLDKAAQIRVSDELFGGTGGEQFVQLIAQGEAGIQKTIQTAHELGLVLDEQMIKKADEIDRKFNLIATTVSTNVKGAIIDAIGALQNFNEEHGKTAGGGILNGKASLGSIVPTAAGLGGDPQAALLKERSDLTDSLTSAQGKLNAALDTGAGPEREAEVRAEINGLQRTLDGVNKQIAAQRELNTEKERTANLDRTPTEITVTRPSGLRDDANTYGHKFPDRPTLGLPNTVNATPEPRVDPYFSNDTGSTASKTGAAASDSTVVALIKEKERFRANSYWDVNHYRAGFGSDTTTRANGSVEKITSSSVVSLADANRDLSRRIGEFQETIKKQIGGDTLASFTEDQQAALTSVAYNYGSLPDRIVNAIQKGGSTEVIGKAIRNLGDDNKGVNRQRRADEADMFLSGSGSGDTPAVAEAKLHKTAIDDLQESYSQLGQIGVTALDGLANALADGKLEGKEVLQILFDVAKQLLSMPNLGALLGGGTGAAPAGGGGGGLLGSIFGSIFGGGFKETGGGFKALIGYAGGTNFAPGGPARINERGGEIVDLPRGARVIPHDLSKRMAGNGGKERPGMQFAPVTNITVGANAGVTKQEVEQIVGANNQRLKNHLEKQEQNRWRYT